MGENQIFTGPQVLVHVSIYQGKPFWVPIFDPQPNGRSSIYTKRPLPCPRRTWKLHPFGGSRHAMGVYDSRVLQGPPRASKCQLQTENCMSTSTFWKQQKTCSKFLDGQVAIVFSATVAGFGVKWMEKKRKKRLAV